MMHEEPSESYEEDNNMGNTEASKRVRNAVLMGLFPQYVFKSATGILEAGDADGSRPLRLLTY
jgi:hypothetical protein